MSAKLNFGKNLVIDKTRQVTDTIRPVHLQASCLFDQSSHAKRERTPMSRNGRGGRGSGSPRPSMSSMRGLSRPVAISAARTPPKVPFVTPTAFWHTADQTFEVSLPKPGALLRKRQMIPLHVCSISTVGSIGKRASTSLQKAPHGGNNQTAGVHPKGRTPRSILFKPKAGRKIRTTSAHVRHEAQSGQSCRDTVA